MIYGDSHLWLDEVLAGWVGSCQITKNRTNLDLIRIIQVYLKIYLWRLPHIWVDVWVGA